MAPISTVGSSFISEGWSELPIRQRGLFLNDHFFQDSREHFQQALDKVLHDWEDQEQSDWHSSKLTNWNEDIFSDRLKRYRMLRKDHIQIDSQAVTEINNEYQYKIIIDVREFMQGCLKTSIVGERELLVEGSIEETAFGVKGKRTFEKKFLLPPEAILSDTTSALSSDGILTIITPKKVIEKEIQENKKEGLSNHQINQNKQSALNQKHSMFSDNIRDEFLPISRRGHFFSDSSFKNVHGDFNRAVKDVLERWNETSEDDLTSYRNLRRRTLLEDNQAFTEAENYYVYKIVIDVHDFVTDGEVSVKIVNDKYLEVKGCIDKEEDETICKKTFQRRFILPRNTDFKNISSLLSSDGVLTITSPKVPGQIDFKETIIPVKLEQFLKKDSCDSSLEMEANNSSVNNENKAQSVSANEFITEEKSNIGSEMSEEMKKNIDNEIIIPVTLEENDDNMDHRDIKSEQETASIESGSIQDNIKLKEMETESLSEGSVSDEENSSDKCIKVNCGKQIPIVINEEDDNLNDTDSDISDAESEVSCISSHHAAQSKVSAHLDNATSCQENASVNSSSHKALGDEYIIPVNVDIGDEILENNSNKNREIKAEEKYTQNKGVVSNEANIDIEHEKNHFSKVPIVRRGPFFVDSFFNESQKQFEKAVQNVLQQSGFTSRNNDLEFYRSLRQRSNSEQNQANSCTEDGTSFKIVIDVQGFENDDIKIKVHNANKLTVEGEQNKEQNHSLFKSNFCRKFIFPNHINCDAVTSAVSEEGILTINVPKKIKENCGKSKLDESVKSIFSYDSDVGLDSSNKKDCEREDKEEGLCISDNHNNEVTKSVDKAINNIVEGGQILPITKRGSFFTDPFFEDSHLILKKNVRDIIEKSGLISKEDDFSFYKSMLERSTNKENQAETITESDNIYKIVLDIQGFSAEEIKMRFLSSTDLIIEATTEKKEEGSSSARKFRRCFVFPNSVNVDAVTTSLSSDGMLTISAPKKLLEEVNEEGSCSKDLRKHINLNNGWEDEKTHQTSSERDGVKSKTFSKTKSSYHHINCVN